MPQSALLLSGILLVALGVFALILWGQMKAYDVEHSATIQSLKAQAERHNAEAAAIRAGICEE